MSFSTFVSSFLKELNDKNILYVIERNYEHLPEFTYNDIDFLIKNSDKEKFLSIAINVINKVNMNILLIATAYCGGRIYLFDPEPLSALIVRIDFMTHIHFRGIPLLNAYTILKNRIPRDTFYIPSSGMESAISLVVPLIYTGKVKEKYKSGIYKACINDKENFVQAFTPFLPLKNIQDIVNLIAKKKFAVLERQRNKILLSYISHNKYYSLNGLIKFTKCYFQRLINPTGILVGVMGPDGTGKSSVINNLSESIKILYPQGRFIKLHWRTGLLPQIRTLLGKSKLENEFIFTNPHSSSKRSRLTSFIRWFYYSLDYVIGYYLKILPMKIKTTAVVMDRYYYDIIVDPIRYGFNLPKWLLKLPLKIVPKPDLTVYLDNAPEELYKRKQELPISELKRQVEAWREFIPSLPNARIVTTDKPLNDVVYEVTRLVLERRAEMTRKMLKIDPDESRYLWKSDSTGYIALPSKKNCRWIIPDNPVLAKKAWDLYLPYSPSGRIYKNLYRFISSKGLLRYLKYKKLDLGLVDEDGTLKKILVNLFKRDDLVLAISTGTPGAFRKVTAMILNSEANVLGYVKIGETPLAIERIKNEAKILKLLVNSYQLIEKRNENCVVRVPECLYEGEIEKAYVMVQSPGPVEGKSGGSEFNEDYANVLRALIKNTLVKKKLVESEFYKKLKASFENYPLSYKDIMIRALEHLEINVGDKDITFGLSHGDFAPWNMVWAKDKKEVFIYDWEFADFEVPLGHDIVDFLFNTQFFIERRKDENILDIIIKKTGDISNYYPSIFSKDKLLSAETLCLCYFLQKATEQDRYYLLNPRAVERRKLIKLLLAII